MADAALWPAGSSCNDGPAMDVGQGVGRGVRAGRAAVFAAVCVLLATLGHVLVSGTAAPGCALLAGFAGVGGTAWWLADRERGALLVTGLTVGSQAALHLLFALGRGGAASAPPAGGGFGRPWSLLLLCGPHRVPPAETAGLLAAAGLDDGPDMDMGAGMDMGTAIGAPVHHVVAAALAGPAHHGCRTAGMLTAHLLAALLLGLWLAAGERAVFRLGRTLAARLCSPLLLILRPACPPARPRPPAVRSDTARRLRRLLLVHAVTSRGPPAAVC